MRNNTNWKTTIIFVRDTSVLNAIHRCCVAYIAFLSLERRRILFDVLFFYKALSGYINIDISTCVQFYSDTARYPLREKTGSL